MIITLAWDPVTTNYDDSTIEDLAGYFVSHSTDDEHWERLTTTPITQATYQHDASVGIHYYTVAAVDDYGNVSWESDVLEVTIT